MRSLFTGGVATLLLALAATAAPAQGYLPRPWPRPYPWYPYPTVLPYPVQTPVYVPVPTTAIPTASATEPMSVTDRAVLEVTVPSPDAQLTLDGQTVSGTGLKRTVLTPQLYPGVTIHSTLVASWVNGNGRLIYQSRTFEVRPGDTVQVDFTHGGTVKGG